MRKVLELMSVVGTMKVVELMSVVSITKVLELTSVVGTKKAVGTNWCGEDGDHGGLNEDSGDHEHDGDR